MVQEIRKRYGNEKQIFVYPDSSGARRTTNSTGISVITSYCKTMALEL